MAGSLFSRVIGASGFQLININNVPLSLRGWSQRSKLLGRNALINNLIRHYTSAAISEAHKVGLPGLLQGARCVEVLTAWLFCWQTCLLSSLWDELLRSCTRLTPEPIPIQ